MAFEVIDGNIAYLRKAHAANGTAQSHAETPKGAYPGYYGGGWVDLSSLLLYGILILKQNAIVAG